MFKPNSGIARGILADIQGVIATRFLEESDQEHIDSCIQNLLEIYLVRSAENEQEEKERLFKASKVLGCRMDDLAGEIESFIISKVSLLQEDFDNYKAQSKKRKVSKAQQSDSGVSEMVYSYDFTSEQIEKEETDDSSVDGSDHEAESDLYHIEILRHFPSLDNAKFSVEISNLAQSVETILESPDGRLEEQREELMNLFLSSDVLKNEPQYTEKISNFVSMVQSQRIADASGREELLLRTKKDVLGTLPGLVSKYLPTISTDSSDIATNSGMLFHENEKFCEVAISPSKSINEYGQTSGDRIDVRNLPCFSKMAIYSLLDRDIESEDESPIMLNKVQSQIFPYLFFDASTNLLLSSPTGSGKTIVALLGILSGMAPYISEETIDGASKFALQEKYGSPFRAVYLAPMKALVQQVTATFEKCLSFIEGLSVAELSGDASMKYSDIRNTNIIIATPEKWNLVSAKMQELQASANHVFQPNVIVMDEIHILHSERGGVIEAIVARSHTQVEENSVEINRIYRQQEKPVDIHFTRYFTRLIALSASFPNLNDVATFLRVPPSHVFQFSGQYRPVPLTQHFHALKSSSTDPSIEGSLSRAVEGILAQSAAQANDEALKSAIVFVHSRADTFRSAQKLVLALNNEALSDLCVSLEGKSREFSLSSLYNIEQTDDLIRLVPKDQRGEVLCHLFQLFFQEVDQDIVEHIRVYDILHFILNNADIQEHYAIPSNLTHLLSKGIGVHHAGLKAITRSFVETLFDTRVIQLIFSTSTLAWGVNLPASIIIIKGDSYFYKGKKRSLEALDVIQMFGRAGRPGRDTSGTAYLLFSCELKDTRITSRKDWMLSKVLSYTQQKPVESFLMHKLVNLFLLEFSCRKTQAPSINILDAVDWLRKTFWYTRARLDPITYNLDAEIELFLSSLVKRIIFILHSHNLVDIPRAPLGLLLDNSKDMEEKEYALALFTEFRNAHFSANLPPSDAYVSTLGKIAANFAISFTSAYEISDALFQMPGSEDENSFSIVSDEDALLTLASCEDMRASVGISKAELEPLSKIAKNYIPLPIDITERSWGNVFDSTTANQSVESNTSTVSAKICILLQLYLTKQLESSQRLRYAVPDASSREHLIDVIRAAPSFHSDMNAIASSFPRILAAIVDMCMQNGPLAISMQKHSMRAEFLEAYGKLQRDYEAKVWATSPEYAIRQVMDLHSLSDGPSNETLRRLTNTQIDANEGTFALLSKFFSSDSSEGEEESELKNAVINIICKGARSEYSALRHVFRIIPDLQVVSFSVTPRTSSEVLLSLSLSLTSRSAYACETEFFFVIVADGHMDRLYSASRTSIKMCRSSSNLYQGATELSVPIRVDGGLLQSPNIQVKILSERYVGGAVDATIPLMGIPSLTSDTIDETLNVEENSMEIDGNSQLHCSHVFAIPPASSENLSSVSFSEASFFDLLKKLDKKDKRSSPNTYFRILSAFDNFTLNEPLAQIILRILCSDAMRERYFGGDGKPFSRDILVSQSSDCIPLGTLTCALAVASSFESSARKEKATGTRVLILVSEMEDLSYVAQELTERLRSYKKLRLFALKSKQQLGAEDYEACRAANVLILKPQHVLQYLVLEKSLQHSNQSTLLDSVSHVVAADLHNAFDNGSSSSAQHSIACATYEWVVSRLRDQAFYETCGSARAELPAFLAVGQSLINVEFISRWLSIDKENVFINFDELTEIQATVRLSLSSPRSRALHTSDRSMDAAHEAWAAVMRCRKDTHSPIAVFASSWKEMISLERIIDDELGDETLAEGETRKKLDGLIENIKWYIEATRKGADKNFFDTDYVEMVRKLTTEARQAMEIRFVALSKALQKGIAFIYPDTPTNISEAIRKLQGHDPTGGNAHPVIQVTLISSDHPHFELFVSQRNIFVGDSTYNECSKSFDSPSAVQVTQNMIRKIQQYARTHGKKEIPSLHLIMRGQDAQAARRHFNIEKDDTADFYDREVNQRTTMISEQQGHWVGEIKRESIASASANQKSDAVTVESSQAECLCQESALAKHLSCLVNNESVVQSCVSPEKAGTSASAGDRSLTEQDLRIDPEKSMTAQQIMEILQGTYYFQRFGVTPSFYKTGLSDADLVAMYPLPKPDNPSVQLSNGFSKMLEDLTGITLDVAPSKPPAANKYAFENKLMPIAGQHLSRIVDTDVVGCLTKQKICSSKEIIVQDPDTEESEEMVSIVPRDLGIFAVERSLHPETVALWHRVLNMQDGELFAVSSEKGLSPSNILVALTLSWELGDAHILAQQRISDFMADIAPLEKAILSKIRDNTLFPFQLPQRELKYADRQKLVDAILNGKAPEVPQHASQKYHYAVWLMVLAYLSSEKMPSAVYALYIKEQLLPKARLLLSNFAEFCMTAFGSEQTGGSIDDVMLVIALAQGLSKGLWPWSQESHSSDETQQSPQKPQPLIEISTKESSSKATSKMISCSFYRNSVDSHSLGEGAVDEVKLLVNEENWWALFVSGQEGNRSIFKSFKLNFSENHNVATHSIIYEGNDPCEVFMINDFHMGIDVSREISLRE